MPHRKLDELSTLARAGPAAPKTAVTVELGLDLAPLVSPRAATLTLLGWQARDHRMPASGTRPTHFGAALTTLAVILDTTAERR